MKRLPPNRNVGHNQRLFDFAGESDFQPPMMKKPKKKTQSPIDDPAESELISIDNFQLLPVHAERLEVVRQKRNRPPLDEFVEAWRVILEQH